MSNKPIEVIARGVLVRRGQLLVCQGRGAANTYLPGGHVEFGESAPVALEREWMEELGVTARASRFLGAVEHAFRQKGRWHCEINLLFAVTCAALSPAAKPASEEAWLRFRWVPLNALKAAALEPWPLQHRLPLWLRARPASWASTLAPAVR